MYIENGFYELTPGAIGTLHYKKNMTKHISNEVKQEIVSRQANERMRALIGNGMDPVSAYTKARQDSWSDVEEGDTTSKIEVISVQVDQKESIDLINKIESSSDFSGWLNPLMVTALKDQYNKNTII